MILTVVMDRMAAVLRRCLPLRAAGFEATFYQKD